MKFRFGAFGLLVCGIAALSLLGHATIDGDDTGRVATMQVLVRDTTVMARLYPKDQQFARLVLKQWKANAVVDGEGQTEKGWPLIIEPAEIRGLVAHGNVPLSQMHLQPGPHRMSIIFEVPKEHSGRDRIPLTTDFSIR